MYARDIAASQEIGTRMVIEAQTVTGAFRSQNSGGPLSVTKILAAIDPNHHQRHPRRSEGRRTYL